MTQDIKQPTDMYDVDAWNAYYAAHPGIGRSVGAAAADEGESGDEGGEEGAGDDGGDAGDDSDDEGGSEDKGDAGDDKGDDKDKSPWAENWRDDLADGDEKVLKRLGRFNTPKDLLTSYQALETKLNSGEVRGELPENYTDEELTTYREANGIPSESDGYFTEMPDGLVIGDDDTELFNSFATAMHDQNVDPSVVHATVGWYYNMVEEQQSAQSETDLGDQQTAEDALRVEWGDEYRANINTLHAYFDKAPEGVSEVILNARGADGQAIMNNVEVFKFLAAKARDENPYVSVMPQGGDSTSMADEKAELIKQSGNKTSDYWKGEKNSDGETAGQLRLRKINEAEERNAA